jgi:two-component system, OmpR family, response regulator
VVDVTVPPGAAVAADPAGHRGGNDDGGDVAGDVAVVRWPSEAAQRDDLVRRRQARLLVVAAGLHPPPAADGLEDWVREGADPVDVYVRKDRLRRRQEACVPVTLDDDGVLHRGRWWVALSGRDLQVAAVLLSRPGVLVARADVLDAVSPGAVRDEHRLVDTVVRRFQRRVAPLGLRVHTVRSVGFLLDMGELPVT